MTYNLGDELTISTEIRLVGVDTDDPGLTLTVEDPAGASTTYVVGDLVHVDTGHYEKVVVGNLAGVWRWTWTPSPNYSGASAGFFLIGNLTGYTRESWCTAAEVLDTPALRSLASATPPITEDNVTLRQACDAATEFLYSRTWRRFRGLREVELRPCCAHGYSRQSASLAWPMIANNNIAYSGDSMPVDVSSAECGCTHMTTIGLPVDVQAVEYVMVDGEVFTDWRVDSGRLLVRTDGLAWPYCSDIISADSEPNTFSVHVVVGDDVPQLARMAARELAGELFLADADPSSCRIPTRINTVQRQGATYTRVDTTTIGKDGMLGLRITDIFLSQFGKRRREIRIASPDVPAGPRRVGAGPT